MFDIAPYKDEVKRLCDIYGIKRLEVFGSALTTEFTTNSDIDCLIEFGDQGGNYFHRYFDLKYALEELFGRSVDIVVDSAIRNPYFREAVDSSKQLIYAA